MLRTLGIRTWLVWGETDEGGHAWVEAELEGRKVLIESTLKTLPHAIPSSDDASAAYGTHYQAERSYPARTDGLLYGHLERDGWTEIQLAEPISKPLASR